MGLAERIAWGRFSARGLDHWVAGYKAYNASEARDTQGQWTAGGASVAVKPPLPPGLPPEKAGTAEHAEKVLATMGTQVDPEWLPPLEGNDMLHSLWVGPSGSVYHVSSHEDTALHAHHEMGLPEPAQGYGDAHTTALTKLGVIRAEQTRSRVSVDVQSVPSNGQLAAISRLAKYGDQPMYWAIIPPGGKLMDVVQGTEFGNFRRAIQQVYGKSFDWPMLVKFDPDEARDEGGRWTEGGGGQGKISTAVNGQPLDLHDNGTVRIPGSKVTWEPHWDDPNDPDFARHLREQHVGHLYVNDEDPAHVNVVDTEIMSLYAYVFHDNDGKYSILVRRTSGEELAWHTSHASTKEGAYKYAHRLIIDQHADDIRDMIKRAEHQRAALATALPVPSFGDTKHAEQYMQDHWPMPLAFVSFRGVDPSLLQPTVNGLMQMAVKYPDVARTMYGISSDALLSSTTLAQTDSGPQGASITFNTTLYGDRTVFHKALDDSYAKGWLVGKRPDDIAIHEFGHVLQDYLQQEHPAAYNRTLAAAGYGATAEPLPFWQLGPAVSGYSNTSPHEWFSETFDAIQLGVNNAQAHALSAMLDSFGVLKPKPAAKDYDPSETRDPQGRWTSAGGAAGLEEIGTHIQAAPGSNVEALLTNGKPGINLWDDENRIAAKVDGMRGAAARILANPKRTAVFVKTFSTPEEWASLDEAARTGRIEQQIRADVSRWTHASSDTNPGALAMQKAAQVEFGTRPEGYAELLRGNREIGGSGGRPHRGAEGKLGLEEKADAAYAKYGDWNRALLRTMYERTQRRLDRHGITAIHLARGLGGTAKWEQAIPADGEAHTMAPLMQPISSWSSDLNISGVYGGGVHLETVVPASRIIGTPYTGFGSLFEREFIVLDSPGTVEARRIGSYKAFDPSQVRDDAGRWTSGGGGLGASTHEVEFAKNAPIHDLINDTSSTGDDLRHHVAVRIAERLVASDEGQSAFRTAYGETLWDDLSHEGRQGYIEQYTDDLIAAWQRNSDNTLSRQIQMAAQAEFRLDTRSLTDYFDRIHASWSNMRTIDSRGARMGMDRAVLRAMYDETQKQFKQAGIDQVTIYRGLGWWQANDYPNDTPVPEWVKQLPWYDDVPKEIHQQPLSSWTAQGIILGDFSNTHSSMPGWGVNLAVTVPASRILSTARSGLGTLFENEVVMLDGPGTARVNLVKSPRPPWENPSKMGVSESDRQDYISRHPEQEPKAFSPDEPRDEHGRWTGSSVAYAERDALRHHYADLKDSDVYPSIAAYRGFMYEAINGTLRGKPPDMSPLVANQSKNHTWFLDQSMKTHALPQDTTAYRLIPGDARSWLGDTPNTEFVDKGFVSTTTDPSITRDALARFEREHMTATVLSINVPKGTPALFVGHVPDWGESQEEHELLLDRGLHFKITSIENLPQGAIHMTVDVLPGKQEPKTDA